MQAYKPVSTSEVAFYDDSVRHLNAVLEARSNRLDSSGSSDLPALIAALILVGAVVILGYATLVGSRSSAFHAIGAGAIAVMIGFALVVLVALQFPFSGGLAIDSQPFREGALAPFFSTEMTHDQALTVITSVLEAASGPVSVVVVDTHGEVVASIAMTGAARDTYLNARRKAYTAARSDAFTTRQLAEKAGGSPTELASFDPEFSFFLGGVAAFGDGRRVGAVGVSGLAGEVDEELAFAGIRAAGLDVPALATPFSGADDERPQALSLGRQVEAERQQHERVDDDQADRER